MAGGVARRRAGVLLLLLSALAVGCAPHAPRNLLLVLVDTLRPDMLGSYGYGRPTSPNLDRLAAEGVVFENAFAPAPWTLPSGVSLLTGLYPVRHGVISRDRAIPAEAPTLAELMGRHGFTTAAVVNAPFVGARYGFDRGFESFVSVGARKSRRQPRRVVDEALDWLGRRDRDRPFFLFVHHYHVHSDYVSDPRYEALFVEDYTGPIDGTTAQLREIREGRRVLDPAGRRHLVDLYSAGIRQVDDEIERLLSRLRDEGVLGDTLVAVTADHGEEFLEHGGVLHGRTQYDEVLRVPWILWGPEVPGGERIADPVSLVDVLPTLLGLLELGPPGELDGRDLSRRVRGAPAGDADERVLFGEADHNNERPDIYRSARRGRFKLIHDRLRDRFALYDLAADPGEKVDVAPRFPDVAEQLRRELESFAARPALRSATRGDLSPEERAELEALGYLE